MWEPSFESTPEVVDEAYHLIEEIQMRGVFYRVFGGLWQACQDRQNPEQKIGLSSLLLASSELSLLPDIDYLGSQRAAKRLSQAILLV